MARRIAAPPRAAPGRSAAPPPLPPPPDDPPPPSLVVVPHRLAVAAHSSDSGAAVAAAAVTVDDRRPARVAVVAPVPVGALDPVSAAVMSSSVAAVESPVGAVAAVPGGSDARTEDASASVGAGTPPSEDAPAAGDHGAPHDGEGSAEARAKQRERVATLRRMQSRRHSYVAEPGTRSGPRAISGSTISTGVAAPAEGNGAGACRVPSAAGAAAPVPAPLPPAAYGAGGIAAPSVATRGDFGAARARSMSTPSARVSMVASLGAAPPVVILPSVEVSARALVCVWRCACFACVFTMRACMCARACAGGCAVTFGDAGRAARGARNSPEKRRWPQPAWVARVDAEVPRRRAGHAPDLRGRRRL